MKTILITGAAGFIGFSTAKVLLQRGDKVICIDNLNDYYDPNLKKSRLEILKDQDNFIFYKEDICDLKVLEKIFSENKIDLILHIAAQAGVRYSIENPFIYEKTNVLGTLNMLEMARKFQINDFVFSSSSSVYGGVKEYPFKEDMKLDTPVSFYAATKKSGELLCHSYHSLFKIRFRLLRFFTVYGPWGRPDMALFKFTQNILAGKPIDVYNNGDMFRDFTFISDIVSGVVAAVDSDSDYEIYNIGKGTPEKLMKMIEILQDKLDVKAELNMMPMQKGDVYKTYADISKAKKELNYNPKVAIEEGIEQFVDWYKDYYNIKNN